jgi:hypothetical protein
MKSLFNLLTFDKLIDIVFLALDSLVVMWLWNYVMPSLSAGYFQLPKIDYWHAAGLYGLTAFLIRGKL